MKKDEKSKLAKITAEKTDQCALSDSLI